MKIANNNFIFVPKVFRNIIIMIGGNFSIQVRTWISVVVDKLSLQKNKFRGIGLCRWKTGPSSYPAAFFVLAIVSIYFWLELQFFAILATIPPGIALPVTTNSSQYPCYAASPFCEITCKGAFLDPFNFYFYNPLGTIFSESLKLEDIFSANFVSVANIVTGLISACLIAEDSLTIRRIGVLVYQIRNLVDVVDGRIAKANQLNQKYNQNNETELIAASDLAHFDHGLIPSISNTDTRSPPITTDFGYFLDGICDGISCLFLIIACFIYLRRPYHHRQRRNQNHEVTSPMCGVTVAQPYHSNYSQKLPLSDCQSWSGNSGLAIFLYGLQLFLSSVTWNANILSYSHVLERKPEDSKDILLLKSKAIQSMMTWLIIYLWRILNPDTSLGILLFAIFFDVMEEFIEIVKYIGFAMIFAAATLSALHYRFLVNLIYTK